MYYFRLDWLPHPLGEARRAAPLSDVLHGRSLPGCCCCRVTAYSRRQGHAQEEGGGGAETLSHAIWETASNGMGVGKSKYVEPRDAGESGNGIGGGGAGGGREIEAGRARYAIRKRPQQWGAGGGGSGIHTYIHTYAPMLIFTAAELAAFYFYFFILCRPFRCPPFLSSPLRSRRRRD